MLNFVVTTYDAYNRLATETDARGNIKTHAYEHARGLHLGTTYTVVDGTAETSARSFTYNHLGLLTQLMDDSGVRTFTYNTYGERESDSLVVDGDTHLVTELRDAFGRSTGYTYAKNGSVLQTVSTGYGTDGRINSAGFMHGGEMKQFGYEYLQGSNLLHKLTKPNGMTFTQSYEVQRDLLTGMAYHRGSTLVTQREYTYDVLRRPTARTTSRQGNVVNDTFIHNSRSELASAQVNGETYGYDYDNVGNRRMSMEAGDYAFYEANEQNQYTDITGSEDETDFSFTPVFDAEGNQTRIKTETGIWTAVYNAENRPVSFTNEATGTVVTSAYDSMGRRCFKKVTVNSSVTLHQRYLYRGYLQIACIDLTRSHHPCQWLITWDPTQPIATRPLAIQISGTWYTYGWDLTKNIYEVFGSSGYIATAYNYDPFGQVTSTGSINQPIQWNSEMRDNETGLFYYNWRYYNPQNAKWISQDEIQCKNLYNYVLNSSVVHFDRLGMEEINLEQIFSLPTEPPNANDLLASIAKLEDVPIDVKKLKKIRAKSSSQGFSLYEEDSTTYTYPIPGTQQKLQCIVTENKDLLSKKEISSYTLNYTNPINSETTFTLSANFNSDFETTSLKSSIKKCHKDTYGEDVFVFSLGLNNIDKSSQGELKFQHTHNNPLGLKIYDASLTTKTNGDIVLSATGRVCFNEEPKTKVTTPPAGYADAFIGLEFSREGDKSQIIMPLQFNYNYSSKTSYKIFVNPILLQKNEKRNWEFLPGITTGVEASFSF